MRYYEKKKINSLHVEDTASFFGLMTQLLRIWLFYKCVFHKVSVGPKRGKRVNARIHFTNIIAQETDLYYFHIENLSKHYSIDVGQLTVIKPPDQSALWSNCRISEFGTIMTSSWIKKRGYRQRTKKNHSIFSVLIFLARFIISARREWHRKAKRK